MSNIGKSKCAEESTKQNYYTFSVSPRFGVKGLCLYIVMHIKIIAIRVFISYYELLNNTENRTCAENNPQFCCSVVRHCDGIFHSPKKSPQPPPSPSPPS